MPREDVHIRDTIKYTDYKRFGSTAKIIYDGQDIHHHAGQAARPAAEGPAAQGPAKTPLTHFTFPLSEACRRVPVSLRNWHLRKMETGYL